jgi:hypothetical protein
MLAAMLGLAALVAENLRRIGRLKGGRRVSVERGVGRVRCLQGRGEAGGVSDGTIGRSSAVLPGRKTVADGRSRG